MKLHRIVVALVVTLALPALVGGYSAAAAPAQAEPVLPSPSTEAASAPAPPGAAVAPAADKADKGAKADPRLVDRVLGKADAPVTVLDYSSLTCPHCADFHTKILPQVKAKYIDSGKVKVIYRDYPLDGLAMAASMLARCAPEPMYFAFLDALFGSQQTWARASNPGQTLMQIVRQGGMSEDEARACLADKTLSDGLNAMRTEGTTTYGVKSTPTFVVDGTPHSGVLSLEKFSAIVDPLIEKSEKGRQASP